MVVEPGSGWRHHVLSVFVLGRYTCLLFFNKERNYNPAQWFIPVIPAAGRQGPEIYKFKGYTLKKAKG